RDGVPVVVIDAAPGPEHDLRASTFHPPTLDMLDTLDLARPLIAEGLVSPTWQIRMHETHEKAEFDVSMLAGDTAHPYRLQCEQHRLVRIASERIVAEPNADMRWGTRLTNLTQDAEGVTAAVETAAGPATIRARYLIGADGARSAVRDLIGLAFTGHTYPETTILAVTPTRFEDHLPGLSNVNYCWRTGTTFSLLRLRDFWRVSLYPEGEETIESAQEPDAIQRKLQAIAPLPGPYEVREVRPYRVHMRIVDTYRVGRVLLAGDAAHINSPSGGMGMNGGIHDAFELTDALSAVWRGGDERLLDRYTRRRRPVAEAEILTQADRNRARMQERDPEKRRAALAELQAVAADPVRAREHLLRTSMIAGLRKAAMID
ncbi:MAG: FAD-dependent monooxygenase, partial [Alphaproteobacteria bacterium]|nr:FAD-dependent monooxygenase [Alphaproteobacteria bacterium]